jgi:hypothetical protein
MTIVDGGILNQQNNTSGNQLSNKQVEQPCLLQAKANDLQSTRFGDRNVAYIWDIVLHVVLNRNAALRNCKKGDKVGGLGGILWMCDVRYWQTLTRHLQYFFFGAWSQINRLQHPPPPQCSSRIFARILPRQSLSQHQAHSNTQPTTA